MTYRALSYHVPLKRLSKLGRSAGRKVYRTVWVLTWLWLALYLGLIAGFARYGDAFFKKNGIGDQAIFLSMLLIFFVGLRVIFGMRVKQLQERADFNESVNFTQDDNGLRFATSGVEYYLKWKGISQLLLEPDGVVVSHGNLFWLVPYSAFLNHEEGLAFARDVFDHLNEKSKTRSEPFVRKAFASVVGVSPE